VGLGPYALVSSRLGVLVSILSIIFYFLKFPIAGPRLTFGDYLKGKAWVHSSGSSAA